MATAQAPAPQLDEATRILAFLDAANKLGAYAQLSLFSDQFSDADVLEYALTLWASANQRWLVQRFEDYNDGKRYRFLDLVCAGDADATRMDAARITVHFPGEPVVEVREPAPGVVIQLPVTPPVTEPAQPRDLDEAAARFSLLELD